MKKFFKLQEYSISEKIITNFLDDMETIYWNNEACHLVVPEEKRVQLINALSDVFTKVLTKEEYKQYQNFTPDQKDALQNTLIDFYKTRFRSTSKGGSIDKHTMIFPEVFLHKFPLKVELLNSDQFKIFKEKLENATTAIRNQR